MAKDDDSLDEFGLGGKTRDEIAREPATEKVGNAANALSDALNDLSTYADVAKSNAFQEAVAKHLARRKPIIQKVEPKKNHLWPIAFGPQAIGPGETAVLTASPRLLFRGHRLVNTGDEDGLFINGIFVGQKSQLPVYTSPIPVKTFAPRVLDNELFFDSCDPALQISLQVFNAGKSTATFSATLFGRTIL